MNAKGECAPQGIVMLVYMSMSVCLSHMHAFILCGFLRAQDVRRKSALMACKVYWYPYR